MNIHCYPLPWRLIVVGLAIVGFGPAAFAAGPGKQNPPKSESKGTTLDTELSEIDVDEVSSEVRYWIGVSCDEASPLLRAHLSIDGGLAILDLANDSPAQRAQLKQYDVILTINGQPVRTIAELTQNIQTTKTEPLDLGILRAGKPMSVKVQPEICPRCDDVQPIVMALDENEELDEAQLKKLREVLETHAGKSDIQLMLIRPGVKLEKGESGESPLSSAQLKKGNAPNGAMPRVRFDEIEKEAVLFDWTELQDGQALSGCCMKLLEVLGNQIAKLDMKIEQYEAALAIKTSGKASVNEEREKIEERIQLLRMKRDMLLETRAMLKAKIEEPPPSEEKESNPGQSKRNEFRLRDWS